MKSAVTISIKTTNGHEDSRTVSTAGGTSRTFDIPANEGDSVQVCVSGDIVGAISQPAGYLVGSATILFALKTPTFQANREFTTTIAANFILTLFIDVNALVYSIG